MLRLVTGLDAEPVILDALDEIALVILAEAQIEPVQRLALDLEGEPKALVQRLQRGLQRRLVNGKRRVPLPPARTRARVFSAFMNEPALSTYLDDTGDSTVSS